METYNVESQEAATTVLESGMITTDESGKDDNETDLSLVADKVL